MTGAIEARLYYGFIAICIADFSWGAIISDLIKASFTNCHKILQDDA